MKHPLRSMLSGMLSGMLAGTTLLTALAVPAEACTRAVYIGSDNTVITGRTMDWMEDLHSNLWVFPRGIERHGSAGPGSVEWTSKYGSLVVSGYDIGTADGMNEAGLVANLLYLAESDYGVPDADDPVLSISLWMQYVLDNFGSVSEAVDALRLEPFQILAPMLPNDKPASLHLAISDPSGDSAIFEYIDGELAIHHGKQFQVMTNSPRFDDQIALNAYWQSIGGTVFMPGTNRAADRFARATFLIGAIPTEVDPAIITAVPEQSFANQAAASVLSVMRAVSVPLGITTPGQPNIASTLWRTVADQKHKIYFFDSATSPNTFWVPLADLDFSPGAPIMRLAMAGGQVYAGNAAGKFEPAEPFVFLPAK